MLLIQNARILGHSGTEDILIGDDGRYLKIAPQIDASACPDAKRIDAGGDDGGPYFCQHAHAF